MSVKTELQRLIKDVGMKSSGDDLGGSVLMIFINFGRANRPESAETGTESRGDLQLVWQWRMISV